ncbi:MAG: hypothetical protein CMJ05_00200 [Pelagibacterales bacterium]|jgi:uncharacterized membrane protein|nr:hypothetical protein [Pelagibacterales bacterium]|tara:strand:- start:700 stop:1173 length:474 start_codon:yes stop_codon:yes gene_type:complete
MKYYLDIKIYRNQSLTTRGLYILMFFITIPASYIGISFYVLGAWPVLGFMGFEILLIYIAFKILFYKNKFYEHIILDSEKLNILFKKKNKIIKKIELEPTWVQVKIEKIYENEDTLIVSSHGKKIILANYLIPEERLKLAGKIKSGLREWKNQYSVN